MALDDEFQTARSELSSVQVLLISSALIAADDEPTQESREPARAARISGQHTVVGVHQTLPIVDAD